jgi:hypothetical protein
VVSVTRISYRLYSELPAPISLRPFETKIWVSEVDSEQFLRKKIFFCDSACEVPLPVECSIHQ